MNTKELPPLPPLPPAEVEEWSESGITFRGEGWKKETVEKYATDYAIAAIEAQGVPDGWTPTNAELTEIYKRANGEDVGKPQPLTAQRIFKAMRAMLASAPPAPQAEASVWAQAAGMDTQQEEKYVPCQHCGKNIASDNPSQWCPCPKQASAVQPEPVAWMWQHDETGHVGFVSTWQLENGWKESNPRLQVIAPLYTHPAQQAKPQPLSDEQIGTLSTGPVFSGMHPDYLRDCVRAIEAAHGIQGSTA